MVVSDVWREGSEGSVGFESSVDPVDARMAKGYQPDWDIDQAVGHRGELFVADIIKRFLSDEVEIKTDEKAAKTGNIYIEDTCLRRGVWVDSGIFGTKSKFWATVLGQIIVVVPTPVVLAMWKRGRDGGWTRGAGKGSHPTIGVAIPINKYLDLAMALQQELGIVLPASEIPEAPACEPEGPLFP